MKNLSKKDLNVLLIALGIIILLLTFFLVVGNFNEKTEVLTAETESLIPRLSRLQEHETNIAFYNEQIKEAGDNITAEKQSYPASVRVEDLIMFAVNMEYETSAIIDAVNFNMPELLGDFDAPNADGEPVRYSVYRVSMDMGAKFGYEPLKQMISHIYNTREKTTLDSVSVSFDSGTGYLMGNVAISKIYITDGTEVYVPTDVPYGSFGTDNPFGSVTIGGETYVDTDEAEDAAENEEIANP